MFFFFFHFLKKKMAQIFFEDGQGDDAQKKGQEFVGRWNFHTLPSAPAYASDLRRGQEGMRLHVRGARERGRERKRES